MPISQIEQVKILQVFQALFTATPGQLYLAYFESLVAGGLKIDALAQALTGLPAFFGKVYPEQLSAEVFATRLLDDVVGSRVSAAAKQPAIAYIVDRLTQGASRAELITEVTQTLSTLAADQSEWGNAAVHFNARTATTLVHKKLEP
jgi:hypothetical protein